ncbi:MAG: hypothetical protein LUQ65_00485 [Candidatus Helarchaeota archaeon]|nr:hypothetical protein [Candidatus Helarchaeota archaeon]
MSKLRICLDAWLISGTTGGVEQVIIGLANGLSKLADGDEEYIFLTYGDTDASIEESYDKNSYCFPRLVRK